jgi:hypothetical protein
MERSVTVTETEGFLVGTTVTAFLMLLALGFIIHYNNIAWEREAVERGAAEYILDPSTGDTTWQWKE